MTDILITDSGGQTMQVKLPITITGVVVPPPPPVDTLDKVEFIGPLGTAITTLSINPGQAIVVTVKGTSLQGKPWPVTVTNLGITPKGLVTSSLNGDKITFQGAAVVPPGANVVDFLCDVV